MSALVRPARPADAAAIAAVHVTAWRETYPGILPAETIAARTFEDRLAIWSRAIPAATPAAPILVAEIEGEALGFGMAAPQRDAELLALGHTGEVWSLYLLRRAQGRGLGRRMLEALLAALASAGHASAALWVVDGNPAAGFYAHAGGRPALRRAGTAPGGLAETAFAWPLSPQRSA